MPSIRYHLITFGCQMNVRDSRWLEAALEKEGFHAAKGEEADIIILNTCSVREKPELKVSQTIGKWRHLSGGRARFVILGCVAQQLGQKLLDANSDVILVAGGDNIALVPDRLSQIANGSVSTSMLLDFNTVYREKRQIAENPVNGSAYVTIMQGCDNFCSFCIVPYTRGRQRSRQPELILRECEAMLAAGARELVLLGQNVNAWGQDLKGNSYSFAWLLRKIAALSGVARLKFITSHPKDLSMELVQCFRDLPNLTSDLHLPLQSGSTRILAKMNRKYSANEYLELVNNLKKARPQLALRTDLIVGFPGETETDFEETLRMMEECGFVASYSFCYSDRPGTAASRMECKIDRNIKLERLKELQALQEKLTEKWLQSQVGKYADVMLEHPSLHDAAHSWAGRDMAGTLINVDMEEDCPQSGRIVKVLITEAKKNTLAAKLA